MNVLPMFLLFLISGEVGVTHGSFNSNPTVNGNANGAVCVFPFKYKGISYSECTSIDSRMPWCATTDNYARDRKWGVCTSTGNPTVNGNANGAVCVFPFQHKGKWYSKCISIGHNKPWCATTDNYARDKKWGECTVKDNSDAVCVFPFKYKGISYSECTSIDSNMPWCATTDNYERDRKWRVCTSTGNPTVNGNANGAVCVFPFQHKGKWYSKCISIGHNKPWCATTDNYARDKKWGECTVKDNSDAVCVFPFKYKGISYSECTSIDSNMPWCATTDNYERDRKWKVCTSTGNPTVNGNANGAVCVFPFQHKGKWYSKCISIGQNKPWCATTDNYARDKKWGECTVKDNSDAVCVFPFKYKGISYSECTSIDSNMPWCATTDNYERDRKWRVCTSTGNPTVNGNANGAVCVFPFQHKGKWYSKCISIGHNKPWCATTDNYARDKKWGECTVKDNSDAVCVFPFKYKGISYSECTSIDSNMPWCATTDNYERDRKWRVCTSTGNPTVNGNANGAVCVFPFQHKGKWYSKCISIGHNKPWCATTDNYARDKKWGECTVKDNSDAVCVFPFKYKGISYSECTSIDSNMPWCATTDNYERDRKWKVCTSTGNPTVNGNANGAVCVFPFQHKGKWYSKCISIGHNKPWCATTDNYARDKKWGECTVKDNSDAVCVFPFKYKGISYSECTSIDSNMPWCATTDNYERDRKWRVCTSTGNPTVNGNANGAVCVFPFQHKGKWYSKCISIGHNKPWCATTDNYARDKKWGECTVKDNSDAVCVFPFKYKGISYSECTSIDSNMPWCATTDNYERDRKWKVCTSTGNPTVNGNANGAVCVFPFQHKGKWYSKCISIGHNKPWCATTDNYARDKKWGECTVKDNSDAVCVFPFKYKGISYSECTSIDHNMPWCATTDNYERDRKWRVCTSTDSPDSDYCD
ncbi:uncharacterized protein LOC134069825 [Sardina pilchardus]|uniref:uncharacterized protein LOC134069825 n=1 Tax=Sardina pilchardus TaxID=27697 RepID=UPI002E142DDF